MYYRFAPRFWYEMEIGYVEMKGDIKRLIVLNHLGWRIFDEFF